MLLANPIACEFAPGAVIEDDARTVADFIALIAGLRTGESVEVWFHGVADPRTSRLVAHRLEVDLRD